MELLSGRDLGELWSGSTPITVREVCDYVRQACEGLSAKTGHPRAAYGNTPDGRARLPLERRHCIELTSQVDSFCLDLSYGNQRRTFATGACLASAGLLVAASLPYFTIQLGSSGVSSLPDGSSPKRAFTILEEEFNSGLLTPTKVVIDARDVNSPEVQGAVERLKVAVATDPAFFVNGRSIEGAQPFEAFKRVIDEELARKK